MACVIQEVRRDNHSGPFLPYKLLVKLKLVKPYTSHFNSVPQFYPLYYLRNVLSVFVDHLEILS